ncbi:histone deacetylase family protein [Lewinella cohaerens]|uniref:histone deacetylase family protein n=1 Tax=Lewinella cohaerens TaxID=70995 RepID=UPI00037E6122|nr:histone deacetylase [Lewinella cohaerens]
MIKIAYSPIYKYQLPEGHRFPMAKYELLPEQLLYEGTVTEEQFFSPERLSEEVLLWTHTKAYWQKLREQKLNRKEERAIGFPMRLDLIERGRHISQGTIQCAQYARRNGVALNIAGGTHHAFADRGEGFCVFNDFAIAANYLLRNKESERILIVDLDVHQGNGTARIFKDDPRVFTFSMHGERNYPLRKEHSDLDIGLPDKTEGDVYLQRLEATLPDLLKDHQPDMVFYLAGVDVLATDRLGRLSLSLQACKQRDQYVFETCYAARLPVAVSMGGGYSQRIAQIIEAHANTYRAASDVFG